MGNEAFPMWNPQPKFIFGEENRKFKVLVTAGTYLFVLLFQQIEIPISI